MCYSETYIKIEKLFNKYGLDKVINEPRQITGGLMHKMYKVITEHKNYAVKELNSSIMQRNGVIDNMINSERIATALEGIIPVIPAIQFNNTPLLLIEGQYYLVFEWIDGMPIYPPHISIQNCIEIGTLLGKMHSVNIVVPGVHKKKNVKDVYEWNKYLLLGQEINAEWIHELSHVIDELIIWNQESNEAYSLLTIIWYLVTGI